MHACLTLSAALEQALRGRAAAGVPNGMGMGMMEEDDDDDDDDEADDEEDDEEGGQQMISHFTHVLLQLERARAEF